jgi:hypothetical protein
MEVLPLRPSLIGFADAVDGHQDRIPGRFESVLPLCADLSGRWNPVARQSVEERKLFHAAGGECPLQQLQQRADFFDERLPARLGEAVSIGEEFRYLEIAPVEDMSVDIDEEARMRRSCG